MVYFLTLQTGLRSGVRSVSRLACASTTAAASTGGSTPPWLSGLGGGGLPPSSIPCNVLFKKVIRAALFNAFTLAFPEVPLTDELKQALKIEIPKLKEHGDYGVALFPLAKACRLAPSVIAQKLKAELDQDLNLGQYFAVFIVGPYLNFKFTDSFLLGGLAGIDPIFGRSTRLAGQRILVEFVSANPTGPLHIGHGRWAVLGDSICRLLEASGATVTREFYINDAGAQIDRYRRSVAAVQAGQPIPEDGYKGAYVQEIARLEGDPVTLMLEQQRQTLAAMGVSFDIWFSEKTLHEQNKVAEAIALLERLGLTYRAKSTLAEDDEPNAEKAEEGEALWFRSSQFGDEKDRVLVRANGVPTYFAADVAYHLNKIQRGYDLLINIFGADHHGYVARISAAIQALSEKQQAHQIIIGQLVKLVEDGIEVRMSKRKGTAIMLSDLIEEIGPDATRVFMGSTGFDTALNIDLKVATAQTDDNPVYYVQYAHARISQILKLAQTKAIAAASAIPATYQMSKEERDLLALLFRFPDQVAESADFRSVHQVLRYTIDLATLFHSFYMACRVVDLNNLETSAYRLVMVQAVQQTLKNAFNILGITAPDEMRREAEAVSS